MKVSGKNALIFLGFIKNEQFLAGFFFFFFSLVAVPFELLYFFFFNFSMKEFRLV